MSTIKKQLASGVFYNAIAKYTGVLISIVITGILSRLLTPEDYGTVVPITVLITFFTILGDIGIGPAIIQSKELSKEEINSLFSFTVFVGGGLSVFIFFKFLVNCKKFMIQVYSSFYVSYFLLPCSFLVLTWSLMLYYLRPDYLSILAIRSLVVQTVAGTIAIIAAYWGAGVYALVIQTLISSICFFFISYMKNPLKLCFRKIEWSALGKIRDFSSYQFLFDILNYFSVNLDKLLISKYIGVNQLGYYDKSYKLMQMPMQNIPFIITPVMHPIFSEMQNDLNKMCIYYSKVVRFLAFVGFPLSILLFFSGKELIYIVFGTQWEASVPAFKILVLSVGFQIILSTSGSIFQSAGVTKLLFLSGVLSTIVIVIAVMIGLLFFGTIEAVSFSLLCAFIINFFQAYIIMYCKLFRIGLKIFIKNLLSPLLLTAILAGILFFITLSTTQLDNFSSLFIKGSMACIISVVYIQFTGEYNFILKAKDIMTKFLNK